MKNIVLVANNVRSTFNVGSLFRTAEGLGVAKLYLCGYTPYPRKPADTRLPHISEKTSKAIHKTALGAETNVAWEHREDVIKLIGELRKQGYGVCALEQSTDSTKLPKYMAPENVVIILGEEVSGLSQNILSLCDNVLEIPMFGKKESFNVSSAAAMALYHLRFIG